MMMTTTTTMALDITFSSSTKVGQRALILLYVYNFIRHKVANKKLSYRRETARQHVFSARSLIVHFTEHRICCTTRE